MVTIADQKIAEYFADHNNQRVSNCRWASVVKKDIHIDEKERSITGVITTEAVDRDREVVMTRGLDLDGFRDNPVVLFMHDPFSLIGKSVMQKIRRRDGRNEMIAKTIFAETPLAQEQFELVKHEFLRGISIGMSAHGMVRRPPKPEEIRKHPELSEADAIIEKAELLEFSFVTIPANQEALTTAITKGWLKHSECLLEPFIRAIKDGSSRKKPYVRAVAFVQPVKRVICVVPPRPKFLRPVAEPLTLAAAERKIEEAVDLKLGYV